MQKVFEHLSLLMSVARQSMEDVSAHFKFVFDSEKLEVLSTSTVRLFWRE